MPEVEAPVLGAEVDTSDPKGSIMSVIYAVGGVGLLVMILNYGRPLGQWATQQLDNLIGTNTSGDNPLTRGEL